MVLTVVGLTITHTHMQPTQPYIYKWGLSLSLSIRPIHISTEHISASPGHQARHVRGVTIVISLPRGIRVFPDIPVPSSRWTDSRQGHKITNFTFHVFIMTPSPPITPMLRWGFYATIYLAGKVSIFNFFKVSFSLFWQLIDNIIDKDLFLFNSLDAAAS